MSHRASRILEIGNYPPPRCGWAIRTEYLVNHLRAVGAECEVLNIGPSRRERRDDCVGVRNGPDYLWKLLAFGARRYRFHVHANGDSPKGFVLAVLALVVGALFGKRPVLTFHAGVEQKYFPRRGLPWRGLFGVLFGLPSRVVCNSEPVRREIIAYGAAPDKVHAIPAFTKQYVAGGEVAPELSPALAERRKEHSPLLVVYAYDRPEFFLVEFLEVLAAIVEDWPGMGVVLVGPFQEDSEVVRASHGLGLDGVVTLAGDLPHDQFLALLEAADLYVRTHLRDGVSSSVLEALALGTPVVAAANETRPPSVRTYKGTDSEDLRRCLQATLADLQAAKRSVTKPDVEDTLVKEARLLLALP